jgi:hypothetical protein
VGWVRAGDRVYNKHHNNTTYTITDSQPNQIKIYQPNQSKKSHKHNNTYQKITEKKSKRKNHGKKKKRRKRDLRGLRGDLSEAKEIWWCGGGA